MKRRSAAFIAAVVLLISLAIPVAAAQARLPTATVPLRIEGTTANCSVMVTSLDDEITATLSLWRGSTFVVSWTGSGTSVVVLDEDWPVSPGNTYTLKVNYTVNGEPFTGADVTQYS